MSRRRKRGKSGLWMAWNESTGLRGIDRHAFLRFVERHLGADKNNLTAEFVEGALTEFKESFRMAKQVKLDPAIMVRRLITHRFEEAVYLENESLNLRYVVSVPRERIITVERTDEPRRTPQGPNLKPRRLKSRHRS